jgi:hypothetical protein
MLEPAVYAKTQGRHVRRSAGNFAWAALGSKESALHAA